MKKNRSFTVKHQQDYFNNLSSHYSEGNQLNVDFIERLKRVSAAFIRGNVLDIGNGGILSFDYQKGDSIVVGDLAMELLKTLKTPKDGKLEIVKNSSRIKRMELNVLELPFKDESFDTILMFNVAHHLSVASLEKSKKNVNRAFSEISRVLKKDGTFLFLENCPTLPVKMGIDLTYEFWYWLLMRFGKPLPYFLSVSQINNFLGKQKLATLGIITLNWSKKIYQPIMPMFSPPGWLWKMVLKNQLFIVKKNEKN